MNLNLRSIFALGVVSSLGALALLPALGQAAQNPRIALVIGNAAYPDHPLATTANDAGLVAQTLQAAGFDVVGARDLDEKSLRSALRDFVDKAASAGPGGQDFIYLAGRAVQYEGDNYFVPVDAQIARDADVPIQAVKISDFTHGLAEIPGRQHIVVFDAARANDFASQGSPLAAGLALVDAEPNSLVAFNAAPGTVAPDEPGPYGVYGKDLAGLMRQGGVPIDEVFAQARLRVNQDTAGAVVPWSVSKLEAPLFLFDRAPDTPQPAAVAEAAKSASQPLSSFGPQDAYAAAVLRDTLPAYEEYLAAFPNTDQARRIRAILAARREALFWRRAVRENTPRAYWTYMRRYPNGPHVADAQRRLDFLRAEELPPQDFAPVDYSDLPPPPPDEGFYAEAPVAYFGDPELGPPPPPPPAYFVPTFDSDWTDLPPPPPPVEYGYLPVLPIAIPLVAGAMVVSYQHMRSDRGGVGVPGAKGPTGPTRPLGSRGPAVAQGSQGAPPNPPHLPKGVVPKAPTPPKSAVAKPIPIPGTPGGKPVSTAPNAVVKPLSVSAPPAGGPKPVVVQPLIAPASPAGAPKPLPTPAGTPAAKPTSAPPTTPSPAGQPAIPPKLPSGPPVPTSAPTPPNQPSQAPTPAVGAKPSRTQPPAVPMLPAGGAKPLPAPASAPSGTPASKPPTAPNPGERPAVLPKPATGKAIPTLAPAPKEPLSKTPAPAIGVKPQVVQPAAIPRLPIPKAAAQPVAPIVAPPSPGAAQKPAPPQPFATRPGPVVPMARPSAPPPPAQPAPPPAVHAAPPPPAAQPVPPPMVHAAPPRVPTSGHPAPACGGPQKPPCPK